jgi:hypothetical protein
MMAMARNVLSTPITFGLFVSSTEASTGGVNDGPAALVKLDIVRK